MSGSPMDRSRQAYSLFGAALDLPPEERAAFVERACADDAELCAEVGRLLGFHRRADGFLNTSAVELAAPMLRDAGLLEPAAAPARIGPFRVVRELGRGGMGTVYVAERDDGQFEQRVALKLIRDSGAGPGAVRRFLEERQILALLQHPGIARLMDGGITADGQPYFAMELVEGEAIDRYCDNGALSIERRLELFGKVCDAVQYAHRHLVVHRDLKPANILVTADGQVKLLDFGIAKLLEPVQGTTESGVDPTRTGVLPMTPEYAAPEQVRGEPVSTATDLYALGVVLYALLTGRRPYEVRGLPPAEVERIVCGFDPPRPSATFAAADVDAARRAQARGGTPDRIRRRLRGDLDLIVLMALRKEPERRYPSAAALVEDLRRFRAGRTVLARPDSAAYRIRRFVGRNRGGVAAAAALALLLAGFGARERTLRARAEAETLKAQAVQEYLVNVFDVADPFAPPELRSGDVSARALLDRGAARVESVLGGHPAEQADLRAVFGRVYSNLGVYDRAEEELRRSLEQRRALHGERHLAVAEAMAQLGEVLLNETRLDEAEPLLRQALALRRARLGNRSEATAQSLDHLAQLLQERNDFAGAEPLFREALEIRRSLVGDRDPDYALSLVNLGLHYFWTGAYDDAEPLYREAAAILEERLGPDHPRTSQALQNLAQVQQLRGQLDEAEALFRRALAAKRRSLGDAHPSVTINLNNLANLIGREMGKLDEAEALVREALELDRRVFGETHANVAASLNNLGNILQMQGNFAAAEDVFRQSLAVNRQVFGEHHNSVALNYNSIAQTFLLRGDASGAVPLYRKSYGLYTQLLGEGHPYAQTVALNLARALREAGLRSEAEGIYRDMLGALDADNAQHHTRLIGARVGLGQVLTLEGRLDDAQPLLEQALEGSLAQFGPVDWRTGEARLALGSCLLAARQYARAEPLLLEADATLREHAHAQPRLASQAAAALDRLRRETDRDPVPPR
jgi:eukaryotic-like serine/threonine-protein kinase